MIITRPERGIDVEVSLTSRQSCGKTIVLVVSPMSVVEHRWSSYSTKARTVHKSHAKTLACTRAMAPSERAEATFDRERHGNAFAKKCHTSHAASGPTCTAGENAVAIAKVSYVSRGGRVGPADLRNIQQKFARKCHTYSVLGIPKRSGTTC